MSYLVLARKYRPQTLDALVGQQHIARALSNAIWMDRVAHAYLFCGARGTGKTSTARIVAKMLNCATGPTVQPCGECRACVEIASGSSIDVYELDAASNRGVNEIRELREGVGYAPARDRHKVYIVDEAHMLTTEAANAFLKTLEEPPDHAVFILATTDPQRLPITIRSRCQRYDFRRVRAAEVVAALREIVTSEGVGLEDDALYLVAREGDGSMRDSLSVLDQVIAFGGDSPSAAEVAALLGVADRNRTASLIGALLSRDTAAALEAIGAAHAHGIDLRTFARNIAMEARDVLVVRLGGAAAKSLVDRSDSELAALKEVAEGVDTAELERLAHVLLEVAEAVAQARHPRLVLEMGAVRLCRAARLTDVTELASRVEHMLRRGGGRPGPGGGRNPGSAIGQSQRGGGLAPPRRGDRRAARTPSPKAADSAAEEPASPGPPTASPTPSKAPQTTPEKAAKPDDQVDRPRGRSLRDVDLRAWEEAVRVGLEDPVNASLLANAVVQSSGPGRVALGFRNNFYAGKAGNPAVLEILRRGAEKAFGGAYTLTIAGVDDRARTDSMAAMRQAETKRAKDAEVAALQQDEAVSAVMRVFRGELVHAVSEQELSSAPESP